MKKSAAALSVTAALLSAPVLAHDTDGSRAVPHLDHVFLIMMENQQYSQVIGNANAPFINELAAAANLATDYYGVGHPSLTNYLEVVGGSNFGIENDKSPNWHNGPLDPSRNSPIGSTGMDMATAAAAAPFGVAIPAAPYTGMTIADQLVDANKSWKSYQESLPASGADNVDYSDGDFYNLDAVDQSQVQHLYAVKHNPFVYFAHVQDSADPKNGLMNSVGFDGLDGLWADLRSGHVPNLAFIAPNQCHDMHGAGGGSALCSGDPKIQAGDKSAKKLVEAIKASPAWQHGHNAIVIVWDENDFSSAPNRVVSIVDTNYGVHGVSSDHPYTHFSLLKTLETGFGLDCLNHACDANVDVMSDLFADDHGHH